MRALNRLSQALVIATLGMAALPALAATATSQFNVTITIQGVCDISSASNINFGGVLSQAGTHSATGTIVVQCTTGLPFTLGLNEGTVGDSVTNRQMQLVAGTTIPYTLSNQSAGGANWGNEAGSWVTGTGVGIGATHDISFTVYAQATVSGTEPAGTYEDTVTATITY